MTEDPSRPKPAKLSGAAYRKRRALEAAAKQKPAPEPRPSRQEATQAPEPRTKLSGAAYRKQRRALEAAAMQPPDAAAQDHPREGKALPAEPERPKADKPSGAANRKRRAYEEAAGAGPLELGPELLEIIGEPPIDDTAVLPWYNRVLKLLTHQILIAPGIPLTERARHIREMSKSQGMIFPRAELQALLKAELEKREGKLDKSGGTTALPAGAWTGGVPDENPKPS